MSNKPISEKKRVISYQCFQCLTLIRREFESRSRIESIICKSKKCQAEHERMRHNRVYAKKYHKKLNEVRKQLPTRNYPFIPKLLHVGSDRKLFYGDTCLGEIVKWDKEAVYVIKLGGAEACYRLASIKNPKALKAG